MKARTPNHDTAFYPTALKFNVVGGNTKCPPAPMRGPEPCGLPPAKPITSRPMSAAEKSAYNDPALH
jgi:hypothetical protein